MKNQIIPQSITQEIKELYIKGYSGKEIKEVISKKYQYILTSSGIINKLRKEGIKIRNPKEAQILCFRNKQPINKILELYNSGRPIRELSRKFNVGRGSIKKILNENNIEIKDSRSSLLHMGHIKEKRKLDLSLKEKAYLYGLVMGDLTVVKKSNYTIGLITHTTHKTFADLLRETFEEYGIAKYKLNKRNEFRFQSYIDYETFSFLLESKEEKIPDWIDSENFFNFLAGFIDSDGSIILNKCGNRFKFAIRFFGENLVILRDIERKLKKIKFNLCLTRTHKKGKIIYYKGKELKYNNDYFTLEIQKKKHVIKLLEQLPIRHPEKIARKNLIYSINNENFKYWKDIEEKVKKLRNAIKQATITKKSLEL